MSGPTVAISLDQDRLAAVSGTVSSGRLKVKSWFTAQATAGLDLRDAAAVGAWVQAELGKAGLGGG